MSLGRKKRAADFTDNINDGTFADGVIMRETPDGEIHYINIQK